MAVWGSANPERASHDEEMSNASPVRPPGTVAATFAAMSARRLLVFGGIALVVGGMLFGDIFAVFILHQNGNRTGTALLAAAQAAAGKNPEGVQAAFSEIGSQMEDRGTKIDTHVHMTDVGYLALLVALIQPYIALSAARKKYLAKLLLTGGVFLPVGIFLIHYVGLAYSPFPAIGWASVLADSAGGLLIVALLGEIWGLWNYFVSRRVGTLEAELPRDRSWESRTLLSGGTMLILLGFVFGAWYAGARLYTHEARETGILGTLLDAASASDSAGITQSVNEYGALQAERAVQIAAHSHIIEFGLLAMLLAFVQPYVFLGEVWKRRWVKLLLAGSVLLPVSVLLEVKYGLIPGGIADLGGLMVIVALVGMLAGVVRYSGQLDADSGASR